MSDTFIYSGQSIPPGGLVGQVLTKVGGPNYYTAWRTPQSALIENSVTFDNSGTGNAPGSFFDGSSALTVSYNTIGAPSTTGTNASGTWGISISGTATTATSGTTQARSDSSTFLATTAYVKNLFGAASTSGTLDWNDTSNVTPGVGQTLLLGTATNGPGGAQYYHPLNFEYNSKNGTGNITQFAIPYGTPANHEVYVRGRYSSAWTSWIRFLNSDNYNSYSPTLTGTGASGTWGISVTGNAGTATTLQTARTINGVSFNGSANITITSNTTSSLTFNNSGTGGTSGSTFNGGTALTVSHNTIGAQPLDATLTALAGVVTTADSFIYATASDTFTTSTVTSFARTLLDDTSNTQARTTLGLGTIATQDSNNVAITGGSIDGIIFDDGTY